MKILTIIPPHIPSYFNAGHHLPVFQVATYLRRNMPSDNVQALDCAVLNTNWKNVCELLVNGDFDVIAAMNDFDGIDTFERFVHYCRKLSPRSKVITFGRMSKQNPKVFRRLGFDAVHYDGDYESGVLDYALGLRTGRVPGGFLALQDGEYRDTGPGRRLEGGEWVFPDVDEIPYEQYDRMYMDDFNKFCGIPKRRELVVPAARGCSVGCSYCDVPSMQGTRERRATVDYTLDYIQDAFDRHPFEYVTFYAPTFTLNKKWVSEMCAKMTERGMRVPWKCATTVSFLNESMIRAMSEAHCFRISVGVETIEADVAATNLPKVKTDAFDKLEEISRLCRSYGIELNCFIIMGLPGDSVAGLQRTIEYIHGNDARIRPTIYTPYHEITDDMSLADVALFNRQLFANRNYGDELEAMYYRLYHGYEYKKDTKVHEAIPENRARAGTGEGKLPA